MKRIVILVALFFHSVLSTAQALKNYSISVSELEKGDKMWSNFDVVATDPGSIYYTESWVGRKAKPLSLKEFGYSSRLVKADLSFNKIYMKEFSSKEMREYSFDHFMTLGNELFVIAEEYESKSTVFKYHIAKVNKNTGELAGEFTEYGRRDVKDYSDYVELVMDTLPDGSGFFLVSRVTSNSNFSFWYHTIDKSMSRNHSELVDLAIDPELFVLKDLVAYGDNKLIVLGTEFMEEATGKGKKKKTVLRDHVVYIYETGTGKILKKSLSTVDKHFCGGKLLSQPGGDIYLAGYYSNTAAREAINGFVIYKIDSTSGTAELVSFKEINASMLGNGFVDWSEEMSSYKGSKLQLREDIEKTELKGVFLIKSIQVNPADRSFVVVTELSRYYRDMRENTYTRSDLEFDHRFILKDLLVTKVEKTGAISWITDIPKSQMESIKTDNPFVNGNGLFSYRSYDYFSQYGNYPHFSSFKSMLYKGQLILLLNDHPANGSNGEYGKPARTVYDFPNRSTLYAISVDLSTGRSDRKSIYENTQSTTIPARDARVFGNQFLIPVFQIRTLAKTRYQLARVTVE